MPKLHPITTARKRKKITQVKLAKRLRKTQQWISAIENGKVISEKLENKILATIEKLS